MGGAEVEKRVVCNQLPGGVVGIAEKNSVVVADCAVQSTHIRQKAVFGLGEKKFRLNPMHPTTVNVVGIGGAQDQHPPRLQGRAGGVDELGGSAARQDPLRGDIKHAGNGLDGGPAVHLGQDPDAGEMAREVLDQARHRAQRVDVAAHVDDRLDRTAQLLGQGRNVAAVSLNHDNPFTSLNNIVS
jgi:hypothetical protein